MFLKSFIYKDMRIRIEVYQERRDTLILGKVFKKDIETAIIFSNNVRECIRMAKEDIDEMIEEDNK